METLPHLCYWGLHLGLGYTQEKLIDNHQYDKSCLKNFLIISNLCMAL